LKKYPWRAVPRNPESDPGWRGKCKDGKGGSGFGKDGGAGDKERREEAAGGSDMEMDHNDMLDDSTRIRRTKESTREVPGALKESLLQDLATQGRDTNSSGDEYLRDIERWRLSVSV
jgi:hypothetical protein